MVTAARAPSFVSCFAAVAGMHALVRVAGLRRTLRMAQRVSASARGRVRQDAADSSLVDDTARRVAAAAAFYPSRALCLEQSLALQLLLCRRGVPAALRLGVQPRPFQAHAWVEVDGVAVAEEQDIPATLTVFSGLEA